ncbi:MAG: Lrp/AsnC ligand binding domain-containing protein, partial [Clostridia bacterium]|nr:Lrp/AsnC ligand binding domain-containing protein [Clostridia bacterium]
PQRGEGFDKIAERIYQYPEVKSVYLISGGFDIAVTIEGRTMKEVALFVAEKLSTMEHVTSTKTNFILKKYKQDGVLFAKEGKDERAVIS